MNYEPQHKESFIEALFTGVLMALLAVAMFALLLVVMP